MNLTLISAFAAFLQLSQLSATSQSSPVNSPQLKPPASVTPEKDRCTVSGRVTNMQTGEPLKKVTLHLTRHQDSRSNTGNWESTGYSGTSGPDGSFKFEGVEPGDYSLSGERGGFIQTQYGSKTGMSRGTRLNLSPSQQMTDLKLQLVPQATISGRILDEDGDPVGNVSVEAMGRMWGSSGKPQYFPMGQAQTDDTGVFRISNLRPGKYYVAAESNRQQMFGMRETPSEPGKPDIRPVRTFYPGSLDRASASAIDLKPGQEMPGIEIRMKAVETFHIRGKMAGAGENNGQPRMLMLRPSQGADTVVFMMGGAMVAKDGTFDFAGIAPGSYTISSANMRGQDQFISQTVELGSSNVNDVVLAPQPTFTLHGSVELQGTPTGTTAKDKLLENMTVMLRPDTESAIMFTSPSSGMTKADGSFTLEKVSPAKVRVHVMNEPDGCYLKSIRFGSQEVLGKTLDLTQVSGGEIHVVIRAGAAEVSGAVQTKVETADASTSSALAPASSASIILIPEDLTLNGGSVHTAGTNQNGAFTEKGVEPGVYYAVAYELDEYRNLTDPAILKQLVSKGVKVEVKENDKQQVQLKLLPDEELQQALTAAGVDN